MQLQKLIQDGQKRISDKIIIRRKAKDIKPFLEIWKIVSIVGARRTGKTHLMIQYIQDMIREKSLTLEQVVFLDFSELSNNEIDITEIIGFYDKIGIKPFFVLDEVQELLEFEKILVHIYNQNYPCIISWSNGNLLSQELSTKLRGRVVEIYNDILDFDEYLDFKKSLWVSRPKEFAFQDYLDWGWYPEVVLTDSVVAKKSLLSSYLEIMIYKDLIDRYNIKNQKVLDIFIKQLIKCATKQININKIFNGLKSQGYELSKNTLHLYMQYLQNIFFAYPFQNFYKNTYFNKIYLIDNWFITLFGEEKNYGQKLEQVVYKSLVKEYSNELWFVEDTYDIDFTNGKTNWQVCYDLNFENYARETKFAKSDRKNVLLYFYNQTTKDLPNITYQNIFDFLNEIRLLDVVKSMDLEMSVSDKKIDMDSENEYFIISFVQQKSQKTTRLYIWFTKLYVLTFSDMKDIHFEQIITYEIEKLLCNLGNTIFEKDHHFVYYKTSWIINEPFDPIKKHLN